MEVEMSIGDSTSEGEKLTTKRKVSVPPSETCRTPFDRQFELLKIERDSITSSIRQHDDITKNIKKWTIVTWG